MAFPFSVYNIAYLAAEFKSQTRVYCNVIAKAMCLLPSHILIRRLSSFQNTHRNTPQAPNFDCNIIDGILIRYSAKAQYEANSAVIFAVLPVRISSAQLNPIWALPDKPEPILVWDILKF